MSKIFNRENISRFLPFVSYFIIFALVCAAILLNESISIIEGGLTLKEKLLILLNFFSVLIIFAFSYIVNKEFKLIKKHLRKLNRSKTAEEIDVIFNVSSKFKFIKDAEAIILSNIDKKYALVHLDINKFTIINNSVGYKVGDEILQEIGKSLRKSLKSEIIGKAEGDNFFVLFEYEDKDELVKSACSISDKIEQLNIWERIHINPAIKTGIYFINNEDLDIRSAIDRASFAKITLKNSYKSDYVIYEDKIGCNLIENKRIEDDMHKALSEKEFKVYMQPKVNLLTGEISGAEALVRWQHPVLGLLSPDKFIPLFEKNGFIVKLDKYVFEEVCINVKKWINLGYDLVPVSVNVSRIHFLSSNFVCEYNKIKETYGLTNKLIEIEITESVVFSNENENEVFTVMRKFRDDGFEISMDDFGSGYSSLGLLKDMPIDTLKLDKIFLNNIEDYNSQAIISNIVNMAKNLNLNVVSEGVETDMQVDFLRDIGCDMAQGYIFSKPKPMDDYEELIKNGKVNYYKFAV